MNKESTIVGTRARDAVFATVRESIITGKARAGDLIRLGPVADSLGVSITPVREGLLQLARDGWLVQEPNRGFRVAVIRRVDVEDTLFLHQQLRGELVARAANVITSEDLERLRSLDARIKDVETPAGDAEHLNYRLHGEIDRIADAPRIASLVEAAGRSLPKVSWTTIPGWSDMNAGGHAHILQALADHDLAAARLASMEHSLDSQRLLLAWLEQSDFWS
jgi:DNA-binding GntR family transcriptional regulator